MENYGLLPGVKGKKFIVQGFGNVGYWFTHFIQKNEGIVIGIAEFDGSIYNS